MQEVTTCGKSEDRTTKGRHNVHLDMTPMVDLAFLLLTFFMLTAHFMQMRSVDIELPPEAPPGPVPASQVVSVLLTSDHRIFWYEGSPDKITAGIIHPAGRTTHSQDIMTVLRESRSRLLAKGSDPELRPAGRPATDRQLYVIIKPDDRSAYSDLVKLLDVMATVHITKYAIAEPTLKEIELLSNLEW